MTFGAMILGLLFTQAAMASDPAQIFGKWVQKLKNGASMIIEFTPTTISFYAVDQSGNQKSQPNMQEITYRDLGESISIDFKGGGGIMAIVKDQQTVVIDFPGLTAFEVTRLQ